MLLVACDDQGRGDAAPDVVKWYICPNVDEIQQDDIPELLAEMQEQGMVLVYEDSDGEPIFQIIKWWEYQKPQWARESKYPAPEGWTDRIRYNVRGKEYVEIDWNHPGGFAVPDEGDSARENPAGSPREPTRRKEDESKSKGNGSSSARHDDANAFALYADATASTLTPILADRIGDLIDECEQHRLGLPPPAKGSDVSGDEWVCAAIRHAVDSAKNGRISLNFIDSILERWREEGFEAPFKGKASDPHAKSQEAIKQWPD